MLKLIKGRKINKSAITKKIKVLIIFNLKKKNFSHRTLNASQVKLIETSR